MAISDVVVGNLTTLYLTVIAVIKAYGLATGRSFAGGFVLIISTVVVGCILVGTLTWDVSRKATYVLLTVPDDHRHQAHEMCRGGICWHGVAVKSPASEVRKKPRLAHEDRRKILITGRVSYALSWLTKRTVSFLVVLKPSRRERKRKSKQGSVEFDDNLMGNNFPPAPEKLILLRRKQPELRNQQFSGFVLPNYNQIAPPEFGSVSDRLQNLQIQRKNYMVMVSNSYLDSFPKIEVLCVVSKNPALKLCEGCRKAKTEGKTVPFRVNDAVTVAFQSSVGPIALPSR